MQETLENITVEKQHCPVCFAHENQTLRTGTPYWICGSCDVWYQHPMPPKAYEAPEEKGADGRSKGHEMMTAQDRAVIDRLAGSFYHNWISRTPRSTPFYKYLDVGCKYPYLASRLRQLYGVDAYGIDGMDFDSSPGTIPILQQYQQELQVPMLMVDFERVSTEQILENTKTPGNQFHAISMVHVFEHIYNPQAALTKMHSLLIDGGVLFIRVPDHEAPGFEAHLSERHYPIHPFFYTEKPFRHLIDWMKTQPGQGRFEIAETYAMPGGQRDFLLRKS